MKTIRILLFITFVAFTLNSCDLDNDGYSLSDIWVGFGVAEVVDAETNSFYIRLDDGAVIYPTVNQVPWFEVEDKQRLLVNFTVLGDKEISDEKEEYYVRINSLKNILYKGIFDITPETEDSIGNDPIHVTDVWKVDSMLNFKLKFYGNNKTHYINLVKQPGELTADDEPVMLELRHNDRDDANYIPMVAYVTFNLNSLKIAGQDTVSFKVTGVEYNDDDFEYEGVFRYGDN